MAPLEAAGLIVVLERDPTVQGQHRQSHGSHGGPSDLIQPPVAEVLAVVEAKDLIVVDDGSQSGDHGGIEFRGRAQRDEGAAIATVPTGSRLD